MNKDKLIESLNSHKKTVLEVHEENSILRDGIKKCFGENPIANSGFLLVKVKDYDNMVDSINGLLESGPT